MTVVDREEVSEALPMEPLSLEEVDLHLRSLPGWKLLDGWIVADYKARDFLDALALAQRAAVEAERLNHHPDLEIRGYHRLRFSVQTHAIHGLSLRDIALARRISGVLGLPID